MKDLVAVWRELLTEAHDLIGLPKDTVPSDEQIEQGLMALKSKNVKESFSEDDHPRDDNGRFVSKDDIAAAKGDSAKAQALRDRVTDPSQRAKLDKELGGEGKQAAKPAATPSFYDETTGRYNVDDDDQDRPELPKLTPEETRQIKQQPGYQAALEKSLGEVGQRYLAKGKALDKEHGKRVKKLEREIEKSEKRQRRAEEDVESQFSDEQFDRDNSDEEPIESEEDFDARYWSEIDAVRGRGEDERAKLAEQIKSAAISYQQAKERIRSNWSVERARVNESFPAIFKAQMQGQTKSESLSPQVPPELLAAILVAAHRGDMEAVGDLMDLAEDPEALRALLDGEVREERKGYQCPKCGSVEVVTERRPNGNSHCESCKYVGKTGDDFKLVTIRESVAVLLWERMASRPGWTWNDSTKRWTKDQKKPRAERKTPAGEMTPKEQLIARKQAAEPVRAAARAAWSEAVEKGVAVDKLPELADHLQSLTRDEIREVARGLGKRVGGLKKDIVDRLLGHVGQQPVPADSEPTKKEEPKATDNAYTDAKANASVADIQGRLADARSRLANAGPDEKAHWQGQVQKGEQLLAQVKDKADRVERVLQSTGGDKAKAKQMADEKSALYDQQNALANRLQSERYDNADTTLPASEWREQQQAKIRAALDSAREALSDMRAAEYVAGGDFQKAGEVKSPDSVEAQNDTPSDIDNRTAFIQATYDRAHSAAMAAAAKAYDAAAEKEPRPAPTGNRDADAVAITARNLRLKAAKKLAYDLEMTNQYRQMTNEESDALYHSRRDFFSQMYKEHGNKYGHAADLVPEEAERIIGNYRKLGDPVPSDLAAQYPEAAKFTGVAANGVKYVNGVPQKGEENPPQSTTNVVDTNNERGNIPGQGTQPATPEPEAKPMTATTELPKLRGSEKQVKWATDLRGQFFGKLDSLTPEELGPDGVKQLDELRAFVAKPHKWAGDASWWIDRRGSMTPALIRDLEGLAQDAGADADWFDLARNVETALYNRLQKKGGGA